MKKTIFSLALMLLLIVSSLPTAVLAAGNDYQVQVALTKDAQYDSGDTILVEFQVKTRNGAVLCNLQSVAMAYDATLFDVVDRSKNRILDVSQLQEYFDPMGSEYSFGLPGWGCDLYAAKKDNIGYLMLQPDRGWDNEFGGMECPNFTTLGSTILALKPGKSITDVTASSLRLVNLEERDLLAQSAVVLVCDGMEQFNYGALEPDEETLAEPAIVPTNFKFSGKSAVAEKPAAAPPVSVAEAEKVTEDAAADAAAKPAAEISTEATSPVDTPMPTFQSFTDVKESDWFFGAVNYVVRKGFMKGVSDTVFSPGAAATRTQVVTVLWRQAGSPQVSVANPFRDVAPGVWYHDAVLWAYSSGLTTGVSSSQFGVQAALTREQLVTFLCRYQAQRGGDTAPSGSLAGFADASAVGGWAKEAMEWAVGKKIISGMTDTTIVPSGTASRAQLAAMLLRLDEAN